MDHVSDSFLETNVPLLVLIEAAKNGNEKEVKEYAQVFREHANKLIEVRSAVRTPQCCFAANRTPCSQRYRTQSTKPVNIHAKEPKYQACIHS